MPEEKVISKQRGVTAERALDIVRRRRAYEEASTGAVGSAHVSIAREQWLQSLTDEEQQVLVQFELDVDDEKRTILAAARKGGARC